MYYFAYIDADNICTSVYAMPSDLSNVPGYIPITEAQYTSQETVGKRWNADTFTWEEVIRYYYAIVDANGVCTEVVEQEEESTDPSYIAIDSLDTTYVGKWYNSENQTWYDEAPFSVLAAHSTDDINYRDQNTCLSDLLDQMPLSEEVYTKEQADAKFALIGSTGGGSGTPGVDGADGEDGGFYTPSVAADGTLSWTASKEGMPAVGSVNIKGADGEDGQDGAPGAPGQDGTTVVVGTVTTGAAGSSAAVQGVLNEETNTLTLNFTIPQGAQGEQGEKGDAGDAASVDAYTKTQVDNMLSGKADSTHTHDYAPGTHTHSTGDISGLTSLLAGKANSEHTHTEYALSSHTHSQYFPSTGGTITGETNFSGGLIRLKGVQTLFHSGSQLVFGSNNLPTRIGGSAISATKTITVDSDRSLKENIADVDAADCVNFIDEVDVMTYNYIGDSEECIGVIAQDIEDSPLAKFLVRTTAEGKKAVKVADLVFPLIVAVQELSARVAALEK